MHGISCFIVIHHYLFLSLQSYNPSEQKWRYEANNDFLLPNFNAHLSIQNKSRFTWKAEIEQAFVGFIADST